MAMKNVLVAVVLAATAGMASAADTVRIGGVDLPADCPLARKEHPRLLFTRADVPRLKERLKLPAIAAELERGRKLAADKHASAVLLGVLYYLTDDKQYLDQARAKLRPDWDQTYALAADLVMGASTEQEQKDLADRLVEVAKKERWRPHIVLDLAAWGHGHDEYLDKDIQVRLRADMIGAPGETGIEYNNLWSQGRGGSSMAHGYYGEHFYSEWFTMAAAWTTATGQDYVARCDFAAHTPEYYVYHYRPWSVRTEVVHIGVNAMAAHVEAITPAKFEGENLAVLAATRFHDGLGQWWVDNIISHASTVYGVKDTCGVWGKLLWYDPLLPAVEPAKLPPARLFPENGHAVMRSDWTPGATYALFRCGRYGEIDGWWGRNNADNLSFLIEKSGMLAIDSGGVHSLNSGALAMPATKENRGDPPHMHQYARQTIAHNSILVGETPLELVDKMGKPLGVARAGGQSPIQQKEWWAKWGLPEPKPGDRPFKEGDIVAYETSPAFDYAAGDATHSYPPQRVKAITRQFVYLRPDTFIVFDRVENAEPGLRTAWLLHTMYQPMWNGSRVLSEVPAGQQFVIADDGITRAPYPHPGGHVALAAGDTFTIDDKYEGLTGRLFAKLLMPEEAQRDVRLVGGPWHDFEVEGVNYGPTEATYAENKERTRHNRENSIGVAGWRIELSPRSAPASTTFLAVLHACTQSTAAMPPTERITVNARPGARVTVGDKVYEVTFAPTGPVAGHITIRQGDKVILDRLLADKVQDNYKGWSADERYRDWMTRPEYKNFIGAKDVEEYRKPE